MQAVKTVKVYKLAFEPWLGEGIAPVSKKKMVVRAATKMALAEFINFDILKIDIDIYGPFVVFGAETYESTGQQVYTARACVHLGAGGK